MPRGKVRLRSFRLQGYRSCKKTEFELEPRLTALIGPNGAGKTNVMHGLRLLRGPVRARGPHQLDRDQYALKSHVFATFEFGDDLVNLKAEIKFRPGENGVEHPLAFKEHWDLTAFGASEPWVELRPFQKVFRSSREHLRFFVPNGDELGIVRSSKGKEPEMVPLLPKQRVAVRAITQFRQAIDYYSASQFTNPGASPTSFEVDEDGDLVEAYRANHNHHLRFMHQLFRMYRDERQLYESYLDLVGKNGIHLIDEIEWNRTTFSSTSYEVRSGGKIINRKRERTLIIPVVTVSKQQLSFDQLSEGTFRTLATLFHVITDKSSLLLLEEPEVCVHHGLLASVIQVVCDYARRKQIVISTHSEAVLDSFVPEQVRLVRRLETSGTKVTALTQAVSKRRFAALKAYLENEGNLGEYWRAGGLEK